jgi:hypothetical protein
MRGAGNTGPGLGAGLERDPGLDFVRALALVLMVVAHFPAGASGLSRYFLGLHDLSETAPVFFFFAFGMTFDRFLMKDRRTKIESSFLFLYVALAHNLIIRGLMVMDFLAFLCVWRIVLAVIESGGPIRSRYYLGFCALILLGQLLISPGFINRLCIWSSGKFPFESWGMFVVGGLVFARARRFSTRLLFVVLPLAFAGAVLGLGLDSAGPALAFTRKPLSAPYALAFFGVATLMVESVRGAAGLYRRIPIIPAVFEFISRNLLIATAVHYFAYALVADLMRAAVHISPTAFALLQSADGRYVIGAPLSLLSTVAALWAVIGFWERYRDSSLPARLRANIHPSAVIILLADTALFNLRTMVKGPALAELAGGHFGAGASMVLTFMGLAVLTYFCLEMTEHRVRSKAGDGGQGLRSFT